jgi:tRNA-guanine family transglycosylase
MANAIYVPANGQQFESYWKSHPEYRYKNFDIKHFTDQSMFKHNYILTNAYYNVERQNTNIREVFTIPDDVKIWGDSGGFQIGSFGKKGKTIKISVSSILVWLEANADVGMNVDIPPWFVNFNSSIKQSIENFNLFEDYRQNYRMKLYNILHGTNLQEINTWYNAVKNFNFNGWAIGIKPSNNIFLQLLGYLVLHENDALNLKDSCHFFGMSSIQNMISLSMLANNFDTDVTFDSSSFNMGSRMRAYYLPMSVRNFVMFGRDNNRKMSNLPCNCPVCRNTTIQEMYSQDLWYTPILLSLHNLYQFVEVNKMINIVSKDYEVFEEFAKSVNEFKLYNMLDRILKDYNNGTTCNDLYEKYKYESIFIQEQTNNIKRNLTAFV